MVIRDTYISLCLIILRTWALSDLFLLPNVSETNSLSLLMKELSVSKARICILFFTLIYVGQYLELFTLWVSLCDFFFMMDGSSYITKAWYCMVFSTFHPHRRDLLFCEIAFSQMGETYWYLLLLIAKYLNCVKFVS